MTTLGREILSVYPLAGAAVFPSSEISPAVHPHLLHLPTVVEVFAHRTLVCLSLPPGFLRFWLLLFPQHLWLFSAGFWFLFAIGYVTAGNNHLHSSRMSFYIAPMYFAITYRFPSASGTVLVCRSERGYLVRISASHPGVPGSNPIAAPKSLVMD